MGKTNGDARCIAKPQNANTREQRTELFKKEVHFIVYSIKHDSIQVLAYQDAAGKYHYMFPK